jgi:hypothetical protein
VYSGARAGDAAKKPTFSSMTGDTGDTELADVRAGDVGRHGGDRSVLETDLLSVESDVQYWLLNARHMKTEPGRKTSRMPSGSQS